FTNRGKVYWLKVYEIPPASRGARGRPIVNILPLDEGERITTILPVEEYVEDHFVFMATANGTVKKTPLVNFSRPRSSGLIALALDEGDTLIGAAITNGSNEVMLFSDQGKVVRFEEQHVREMGRTARGIRGIRIPDDARVISLIIPAAEGRILTASVNGYGKMSPLSEFPTKGRGGQGVIAMTLSERNGKLVGVEQVFPGDEVMLISDQGTLVRTRTDEISVQSRNTQGVTLIRLSEDENLVGVARVKEPGDDGSEGADGEVAEGGVDSSGDAAPESGDE
ncbi:MAG TPA: DNA gyrase C-terminal beta-propeller domain-containing protein, partial [Motiliproteus sp.]